jgi:hypothetical protein
MRARARVDRTPWASSPPARPTWLSAAWPSGSASSAPAPRAGVGGDDGPEPNRPSRSRDVAPVDSGRAVASREVPGPSSRVNPPFGSFGSGLTRLAVPRSGNTGRRERARSTRQSTAKGQARSVTAGAGLGRDADGSQAVGDRVPDRHLQRPDRTPDPATTPEGSGPPEHQFFRCVPIPCRFRRAPPVSPPEPLGRTAVNLAAGTGCRLCHRSQAGGDLRHMPGFR